jgi:hypothetical protein
MGGISTGIGYASSRGGDRSRQRSVPVQTSAPPKPGLFASAHEKAFHKAVQAHLGGDTDGAAALFREAVAKDAKDKSLSDDFFAGLITAQPVTTRARSRCLRRWCRISGRCPTS